LKQGKTVVHYTLELADTVVARRYDSCLTGIELGKIVYNKDYILGKIKDIEGRLIVKEYPTKSASTNTLKTHLEKLVRRGEDIGLIIVDYGDLLRPVSMQKEKRNELESIYEEMRGIAQIYGCPLWTASQTNRSGKNAELVTTEHISEAFNKCFVADFIFSLSRNNEDKVTDSGRIFIAKNRNGADGLTFPIHMTTKNVRIRVSNTQNLQGAMPQKSSDVVKQQAESLKEKYKKHRTSIMNKKKEKNQ